MRLHPAIPTVALLLGSSSACISAGTGTGLIQSTPAAETSADAPPSCPAKFDDSLETNGIASDFLHGVKAPRATHQPEPEFSDQARKALKKEMAKQHTHTWEGVSVLSMIVGEDGVPRDVCVKKSAGYGLDAQAAKTAGEYRFEPATDDGKPVPARIDLAVTFRLR